MIAEDEIAALRAEDWPFCDICDEPMDGSWGIENDWNGDTGNHLSCEVQQHDGLNPRYKSDHEDVAALRQALDDIGVRMPPGSKVTLTIDGGLIAQGEIEGLTEPVIEYASTWNGHRADGGLALWRLHERLWDAWHENVRRQQKEVVA